MNTLAALEAALRQTPDDPVLLDAVTDYFLERGDPRGEYIRACRVGDTDTRDGLFGQHRDAWMAPLTLDDGSAIPTAWYYCWLKGVDVDRLTESVVAGLVRQTLLTDLDVFPADPAKVDDDAIRRLIAAGIFDRLDTFVMDNAGITDDGAIALAACPAVAKLADLKLYRCQISPIGLDALARVGHRDVGEQNLTPWLDPDVI